MSQTLLTRTVNTNHFVPINVSEIFGNKNEHIMQISTGVNIVLLRTSNGRVFAMGSNSDVKIYYILELIFWQNIMNFANENDVLAEKAKDEFVQLPMPGFVKYIASEGWFAMYVLQNDTILARGYNVIVFFWQK